MILASAHLRDRSHRWKKKCCLLARRDQGPSIMSELQAGRVASVSSRKADRGEEFGAVARQYYCPFRIRTQLLLNGMVCSDELLTASDIETILWRLLQRNDEDIAVPLDAEVPVAHVSSSESLKQIQVVVARGSFLFASLGRGSALG